MIANDYFGGNDDLDGANLTLCSIELGVKME